MSSDPFLDLALSEAEAGLAEGGIPVGAVLVLAEGPGAGSVLGRGHNRRVQEGSAIRHGELDCLERAGRQPASVYRRSTLYTTLSPCDMCTGAILLYGIPRIVVGENRTFRGPEGYLRSRGVQVDVRHDARCERLLAGFVAAHPELWHEDIGTLRAAAPRLSAQPPLRDLR